MKKNNDIKRINKVRDLIILMLFTILILYNNKVDSDIKNNDIICDNTDDFDLDDLYNFIYSSDDLTLEEKDYLYNIDFLNDVLKYINSSDYMKESYEESFNNITINSFDDDTDRLGYYTTDKPNTLYIKNYDCINDKNKDTLAHEFVHLCQESTGYNLIIEACAEIISFEYYDNTYISTYANQVNLVKILMEIIGSEPIWYYNFTGDFSKIEEIVKPNLTNSEYKEFLYDLSFDYYDNSLNKIKFDSLDILLSKLYKNIYKNDIENNLIISLIRNNDSTLKRYYFNDNYINSDNSYYLDYNNGNYKEMSYEEAIDRKLIFANAIYKEKIDTNKALEMVSKGYINLYREIDYSNNNISLISITDSFSKTYITAIIDGIRYNNVDVDELVINNIISVNYYYLENKLLNSSDYTNKNYRDGSSIHYSHSNDTVLNENSVYGFVPLKVYLPTIDNVKVNNDNNVKVKKLNKND